MSEPYNFYLLHAVGPQHVLLLHCGRLHSVLLINRLCYQYSLALLSCVYPAHGLAVCRSDFSIFLVFS